MLVLVAPHFWRKETLLSAPPSVDQKWDMSSGSHPVSQKINPKILVGFCFKLNFEFVVLVCVCRGSPVLSHRWGQGSEWHQTKRRGRS